MTDDGRCENEINSRIAQAKEAFGDRKELLTKSLEKSTKAKIVKTLVWTKLLNVCVCVCVCMCVYVCRSIYKSCYITTNHFSIDTSYSEYCIILYWFAINILL